MANFVKHEPCPSCGSRDNLGRYSDGSAFCFGCHYYERPNVSPFVGERDGSDTEVSGRHADNAFSQYQESSRSIPERGTVWLAKYDIRAEEALRAGFRWSDSWEQLLMPFFDTEGNICCVQAKNFNPKRASKAKYYNIGDKSASVTMYGNTDTVILVEDCISALKIGRLETGYPLLGTSVSRQHIKRLSERFRRLLVWLDADKYREARDIESTAKLLGMETKTIYTEHDPKTYDMEQLKEILK